MNTSRMHGLAAVIQSLIALFVGLLRMAMISAITSAIALVLFTAWIMVQGFRILTGQSREPMMGLVVNASRTTLILIAASTMALGGSSIQTFFTDTLASGINGLVTGNKDKPEQVIDKNLALTAVAMAAIDGAQGLNGSISAENVAAAGNSLRVTVPGFRIFTCRTNRVPLHSYNNQSGNSQS